MSKPVFVFVPGAWNAPAYYDGLMGVLFDAGYASEKVSLPSVGCEPVTYDFAEDVAAIRASIERLANGGNDIVLVLHSYSGQPGSEAVKGLGKQERANGGLDGGVVRIVFIMAFMVPEGFQATQRGSTEGMREFMKADLQNGIVTVDEEDCKAVWYHDLADDEAAFWAAKVLPQSIGVFWSTSTYAGWRVIPSTYVICSDDRSFGVPYAEYQINLAKEGGISNLIVETLDSGHFPMLSKTLETASILRRAAGEVLT